MTTKDIFFTLLFGLPIAVAFWAATIALIVYLLRELRDDRDEREKKP